MKPSTRLSTKEVNQIIGLLNKWEGKLTWDLAVAKIELLLGKTISRQALDKREKIRLVFQETKDRKRAESARRGIAVRPLRMSTEVAAMQKRIDNLRSEIETLRNENDRLQERFAVWLFNARTRGITEQGLNAALPIIDRGWSAGKR